MKLRVGVAQMECELGNLAKNLERMEEFVAQAEADQIDLLVFPELALSGYSVRGRFHEMAVRLDSPEVLRLRELSRRVPMAVGLIEETQDIEFYNSAVYFADGKIRHVHRKIYLPTYGVFEEKRFFAQGRDMQAFDTRYGRMAMLVCGDCWHLPLPYTAVHDGADLLLFLVASSREGLAESVDSAAGWHRLNQTYALTMGAFVIFSNRAGSEEGLNFYGASQIVLPNGEIACQAAFDRPDLIAADLDMSQLRRQRIILPFRRDDHLETTLRLTREVMVRKSERQRRFVSEFEE